MSVFCPILTPEETKRFEARWFGGDESREWAAMGQAGAGVGTAILRDAQEIGGLPDSARLLVLVGKGHNGGDALLAAEKIIGELPTATARIVLLFGEQSLRPLAARALRQCCHAGGARVALGTPRDLPAGADLWIDGVFGFQFRPPLTEELRKIFARLNAATIRFRAAVDLPSGLGDTGALRADFTYATGLAKTPLFEEANRDRVGRVRLVELGFHVEKAECASDEAVLTEEVLDPLKAWRPPHADKRHFGHVFVLGGSANYPGAILMTVRAALRSGAGLVTAFVPEILIPSYAAVCPEAMWVGWPETPEGNLSLEGLHLLKARWTRADALVMGPGMGRERETLVLVEQILKEAELPVVVDADALQPQTVAAGKCRRILTPHAGEFARISGGKTLKEFSQDERLVTVLKGSPTRIATREGVALLLFGGPVLARGGSGDLLAGLIGGRLARQPKDPRRAAWEGVAWHGMAADALARTSGHEGVCSTDLLAHLGKVLHG